MNFLRILGICALVAGISSCRKKTDVTAAEVREAGYEITTEGWLGAIRDNDVAVMRKMVEGGFDHKTKDADGNGGLHAAATAGSKDAAEYLLNKGHSVDEAGANGRTPLMLAVMADRPEMLKWLLRQGADPKVKDADGFMGLMLAATEGKSEAVEELAPYHREDLDSALLLAALVGQAEVIDVLTNYGASVYARMEDGRTPLMLAAQNGHKQAAALLIDIGASRFATTESGDTAQSFAVAAGHSDIAEMIESGFVGDNLAFESDEEVAEAMEEYLGDYQTEPMEPLEPQDDSLLVENNDPGSLEPLAGSDVSGNGGQANQVARIEADQVAADSRAAGVGSTPSNATVGEQRSNSSGAPMGAVAGNQASRSNPGNTTSQHRIPSSLEGAKIGKSKPRVETPSAPRASGSTTATATAIDSEPDPEMPLVMRHYRQRELPVEVKQVSGGVASLRLAGAQPRDIEVRGGEAIPGSNLLVVKVFSRTEQGKLNNSQPIEVGIVEVEDTASGKRREWIAGRSASGHDPVALVEDASTGRRYVAKPGQKFTSEDGREFVVNDVRPTQLVIEDTTSGEVRTLRLRGPKG